MKRAYIIISSLIACIILYFFEQGIEVDYITKTIIKIVLFSAVPVIFSLLSKNSKTSQTLGIKKFKNPRLKLGLMFGIISFAIVIAAYFLLKEFIDVDQIARELQIKSKINASNFIFVGLYITLGNSFLEEFFFRGFVFLSLYNQGFKRLAYVYSSVLFGVYHITIFKTWFNPQLLLLALTGLIIIGIFFNWIDTKSRNFINSWLVHILADSAIILIGMRIFKII